MRAVDLLVNELLPEKYRSTDRRYTKKEINDLVREVVRENPDAYADLIDGIKELGRQSVYFGGATFTLDDFEPGFDKDAMLAEMDGKIALLRRKGLPDKEFRKQRMAIYADYAERMTRAAMDAGNRRGSNLAGVVESGARGNPAQYRAMTATPALYTDYKDEPIDMFVRRSFSDGIRPIDFLASSFGTRRGIISTKSSTADAGDLSKQLNNAVSSIVVRTVKSPTDNAILLDTKDDSLRYRVLARPTAGYDAGTLIDREVEAKLRAQGGRVMVYSPLSELMENGISGEAYGMSPEGIVPRPGYHVGATAGNAIGQPMAQGSLNQKHTGGAYTGGKRIFSGYDYISQFVQVPDSFKDRAAVSERLGRVTRIEPAPHGGNYVWVDEERHYALPGLDVIVKEGDEVEPGDALSDGIIHPRDMIRLRGLGEGRRYFANRFKQLLDDSGQEASLRNTEVLARGIVDAVQITDDEGWEDYLPDDIVSYNRIAARWTPRKGYRMTRTDRESMDRYLEAPLLHYSIGTRLTPRMLADLKEAGYEEIPTHDRPPPFEPLQVRLRTTAFETSDDWLARTNTSYLKTNLAQSAQRGYDTNIKSNPNPYPRIAYGEGFGDRAGETGEF